MNVVELRSTVLVNDVVISAPAVTFEGKAIESELTLDELRFANGACADSVLCGVLLFTENDAATLDVLLAGKDGSMLDVLFAGDGRTVLEVLFVGNGEVKLDVLFAKDTVMLGRVIGCEKFDELAKDIVA
ncbi:hypothetical protein AYO22_06839 [Fonsecaea multimorphosa]|nr:hypothetical protein AYO22_06839 [Fonsecaea multimorphosa]